MWQEIISGLSGVGGIGVILAAGKWLYTASIEKQRKRADVRLAENAGDADTLLKLIQVTPGEVLRLQQRLKESEARCDELEQKLRAARSESDALLGRLEILDRRLADALMAIQKMRDDNGTGSI